MKKNKKILILFIGVLMLTPVFVFALGFGGISMAMGGKVIKNSGSGVMECASRYGPFFITPYNTAPPGPYFIQFGTKTGGSPRKGKYILGNYNVIPDVGTCFNPESGAPIPAFEVTLYGVSK